MGPANTILTLLKEKNERGLILLYKTYGNFMYYPMLDVIVDPQQTQEAFQDVMLRIWQHAIYFDPNKADFESWIFSLARNHAIDIYRSRRFKEGRKTRGIDNVPEPPTQEDTSRWLLALLQVLPKKYRIVMEETLIYGWSQSQAAKILQIPIGTVKTRVISAKKILKTEYEKDLLLWTS